MGGSLVIKGGDEPCGHRRHALGEPRVRGLEQFLKALPGAQDFPRHLDAGPLDRSEGHPAGKRNPEHGVI